MLVEKLRKDKKNPDKWYFTILIPTSYGVGYLRSHGWKYIETSNRILRPTVKGWAGHISDVDEDTVNVLKELIQAEVAHRNKTFAMRSVYALLKDRYLQEGSWQGVYNSIKAELDDDSEPHSTAQWIVLCAAAILSQAVTDGDLPLEVRIEQNDNGSSDHKLQVENGQTALGEEMI
jgi:hypothetical protein